jgi:hypothetical protein
MKTLIIKSLLTSLCQREECPLFGKEGFGEIFYNNAFLLLREGQGQIL